MIRRFTVVDVAQRSPEWFSARCGRLTGSRAKDMLATIKTGEAAGRRDYRLELVCERLTGTVQEDGFVSDAMQRGIDKESAAFAAYEALTGHMASLSGFLAHNEWLAGVSLDGYVGDFVGLLEVKCPKTATHVKWMQGGKMPSEHLAQVTHALWVTGAEWCDFLSFDDRLPEDLQTFLVRVDASSVDLQAYQQQALTFLAEVEREVAALKGWKGAK